MIAKTLGNHQFHLLLNAIRSLRAMALPAITLAILVAIGVYGHASHWSLPSWKNSAQASGMIEGTQQASVESLHPSGSKEPATELTSKTASPLATPERVDFPSSEAVRKAAVTTVPVEVRDLRQEVSASGSIEYDRRRIARISSRVPGVAWRVLKHWGSDVRQGEVLALIDSSDVGRLKSQFAKALVQENLCEKTLDRLKLSGDGIARRAVTEAEAELRLARIELLSSEQALVNLGFPIRREQFDDLQDQEVFRRLQFLGIPAEVTADMDPRTATSNLLPIIAPIAGVVIGRDLGLGEAVEPTKQIFEIADVRKMWITLQVRKEDASLVSVGQEVTFDADGVAKPLVSRVGWISTEVDEGTRTLEVRAEVENPMASLDSESGSPERPLRANVFGRGRILVRESEQAMTVPSDSLHFDEQGRFVFVQISPLSFEVRRVQLGIVQGNQIEVFGPISSGDLVAGHGSHLLKSAVVLARSQSSSP